MTETIAVFIPIVAIVGGLSIAAYSMYLRMKDRELMQRERLAMIERGIVPPPLNPAELEQSPRRRNSSRHAGVFFIALGLGLALVISLSDGLTADAVAEALGVGGLFVMMGLGFLVNAYLDRREAGPRTKD